MRNSCNSNYDIIMEHSNYLAHVRMYTAVFAEWLASDRTETFLIWTDLTYGTIFSVRYTQLTGIQVTNPKLHLLMILKHGGLSPVF